MLKIGLIGYGAIGRAVIEHFKGAGRAGAIAGVLVRSESSNDPAVGGARLFRNLTGLLEQGVSVIAETAGHEAVFQHGGAVLEGGCDLLITSVGALADDDLRQRLRATAQQTGRRIFLPSGAMGGIDAIAAMGIAGLKRVTYRSRKPPRAWKGSEAEHLVDLDALSRPETFFRGTAREAAQKFPKNANVAATVALAGLGMDRTEVELVADPTVAINIHEVDADGKCGSVSFRLEGRAFPDNPRSSMLTAYSVARTLMNIDAPVPI